jgi:hypothetical protein
MEQPVHAERVRFKIHTEIRECKSLLNLYHVVGVYLLVCSNILNSGYISYLRRSTP